MYSNFSSYLKNNFNQFNYQEALISANNFIKKIPIKNPKLVCAISLVSIATIAGLGLYFLYSSRRNRVQATQTKQLNPVTGSQSQIGNPIENPNGNPIENPNGKTIENPQNPIENPNGNPIENPQNPKGKQKTQKPPKSSAEYAEELKGLLNNSKKPSNENIKVVAHNLKETLITLRKDLETRAGKRTKSSRDNEQAKKCKTLLQQIDKLISALQSLALKGNASEKEKDLIKNAKIEELIKQLKEIKKN